MELIKKLISVVQQNLRSNSSGYKTIIYGQDGEAVVIHDSLSNHNARSVGWIGDRGSNTESMASFLDATEPFEFSSCEPSSYSTDEPFEPSMEDVLAFSEPILIMDDHSFMPLINPCSGLPMINESMDIEGNLFGTCSDYDYSWMSYDDDGSLLGDDF